jgi:hypothetical protein
MRKSLQTVIHTTVHFPPVVNVLASENSLSPAKSHCIVAKLASFSNANQFNTTASQRCNSASIHL